MSGLLSLIKGKLTGRGLLSFARRRHAAIISKIDAREGYRLWAPNYADTAISFLDDELAREMLGSLPHTKLLDAGCGLGRRIQDISDAMGMDLSPEMLAAGGARNVVPGDVRAIPFASDRFDMVWCRLILGYLPDPLSAYRELARVCMPGGYVFVTDFHPDAVAAGHRRTFNVGKETVYEIENYVHSNHIQVAAEAGLTLVASREGVVGPSIREFYLRGIGVKAYKRDAGLKLVSAYLFRLRRSNASVPANPDRCGKEIFSTAAR